MKNILTVFLLGFGLSLTVHAFNAAVPSCKVASTWGQKGEAQVSYENNQIVVVFTKNPTASFKKQGSFNSFNQQQIKNDEILSILAKKARMNPLRLARMDVYSAILDDDGGSIGIIDFISLSNSQQKQRRGFMTAMGYIGVENCIAK